MMTDTYEPSDDEASEAWDAFFASPREGTGLDRMKRALKAAAAVREREAKGQADALPPIERDGSREYIPLPGGWEIQTKGDGSSYRILDRKSGERHMILCNDGAFVQDFVTRMAKEIHFTCSKGGDANAKHEPGHHATSPAALGGASAEAAEIVEKVRERVWAGPENKALVWLLIDDGAAALIQSYGDRRAMEERERCSKDAERYRWLRSRDLTAIYTGGIFIGVTPDNLVINLDDADTRIDAAIRTGADHDR